VFFLKHLEGMHHEYTNCFVPPRIARPANVRTRTGGTAQWHDLQRHFQFRDLEPGDTRKRHHNYVLTAGLMSANGQLEATTQLTINIGKSIFNGSVGVSSGDTDVTLAVPEPGTLGPFGSGLIGLLYSADQRPLVTLIKEGKSEF
jgi:hypothetical protein